MINILFLQTTSFNGPIGDDNGLVHSVHTEGLLSRLSYLKYWVGGDDVHDVHGDGGGHRVHRDSNGRSKETYRLRLDNSNS